MLNSHIETSIYQLKILHITMKFQDLYVYLSETEEFAGFKDVDALVWKKTGLVYGDWYSGENEDGTYSFSTQFEASEVT